MLPTTSDSKKSRKRVTSMPEIENKTSAKIPRKDPSINNGWLKLFEPKEVNDLMVNPKKLDEIRGWLKIATSGSKLNRILLLSGPTGSLKLSTIRLLAKEANYDVKEWISPSNFIDDLDDEYDNKQYQKQGDKFLEFLLQASSYGSLFSNRDNVVVVKDLPNIFLRRGNEEGFYSILRNYKANGCAPLIFIITETQSKSNILYRLFPDSLRCSLGIEDISMNAISVTNLKRALKLICETLKSSSENFINPSEEMIESVVVQSQGDIRIAVNNLELISQKGYCINNLPKINKGKGVRSKKEKTTLKVKVDKGVGKDENIDILHGVGRALYPKWNEGKLTHSPEDLSEQFSTQPANYIELMHSNYLKRFNNFDDIKTVTEYFSLCDNFQSEYRDGNSLQEVNFNMIIRGVMVCNSDVTAGFQPIKEYANKRFKSNEQNYNEKYQKFLSSYGEIISKRVFFSDYITHFN